MIKQEEQYRKVVEWEERENDFKNILYNLILTFITGIIYLIFSISLLFIIILFMDLFYFILMIMCNRKVYWEKIK